ncbi:MAG: transcription-repair coupling factor, partial [Desulfobacterales bacterium]|nr:transcription-repair coupling factor [Desulfobacterales bacterium]
MTDAFFKSLTKERRSIVSIKGDGAHKAWFTAEYFSKQRSPLVMILPDAKAARSFMDDLAFFMPEKEDRIVYFPGYNILPFKSLSYHRETSTSRLAALSRVMDGGAEPYLLVTHVDTLLQYLIPKQVVSGVSELVMANEETDRDILVTNLEAGGYSRVTLVEDPGEYAVRGGILDVFSPGEDKPVRIEFFGDLVESIRTFSPFTQRGIKELEETIILPATEAVISREELPHVLARLRKAGTEAGLAAADIREYVTQTREFGRFPGIESMLSIVYEGLDTLFDYLPEQAAFILDDPDLLASRAADFSTKAKLNFDTVTRENRLCVDPGSIYMDWDKVADKIGAHHTLSFQQVVFETDKADTRVVDFSYRDTQDLAAGLRAQGKSENPLRPLVEWLSAQEDDGRKVLCTVSQDAQAKRLVSLLAPYGIVPALCNDFRAFSGKKSGIYYTISGLSSGFSPELSDFSLVTENEIFGKKIIRRQKTSHRNLKTEFIAPEELKNGDIVVHLEHGVGRY